MLYLIENWIILLLPISPFLWVIKNVFQSMRQQDCWFYGHQFKILKAYPQKAYKSLFFSFVKLDLSLIIFLNLEETSAVNIEVLDDGWVWQSMPKSFVDLYFLRFELLLREDVKTAFSIWLGSNNCGLVDLWAEKERDTSKELKIWDWLVDEGKVLE